VRKASVPSARSTKSCRIKPFHYCAGAEARRQTVVREWAVLVTREEQPISLFPFMISVKWPRDAPARGCSQGMRQNAHRSAPHLRLPQSASAGSTASAFPQWLMGDDG
jgi:hypothetical protein